MSWLCPKKYLQNYPDTNQQFLSELKGELDDKTLKLTLAQFLRTNVGFTIEMLTGGDTKIASYQEMLLKGVLNRNFSMFLLGRGLSKSYLGGHLAYLVPLFEPGTNVMICAPSFRGARNVFGYLEKITNSRNAKLLREIFGQPSRRNDLLEWPIVGNTCISSIRATPLNEKIRGFRANLLILDEYLLLSEDIIKNVLLPFLVAPSNIKERLEVREIEDRLIKEGKLREDERMTFPNQSRMVALTSASYTFENLYKTYTEWMENILNENIPVGDAKYFIAQMGYEAVPPFMVDKTIIEEAAAGGKENPSFLREYCARFIDGSDSYFSAKRMHDQTIKDGESPTVQITGNPEQRFILAIDPSWSSSPASDYFAMCLILINDNNNSGTVVHNYMVAGGELNQHIKYFLYLLLSFNIVMIIADHADGNFIKASNESEIFKNKNVKLDMIDYDGDLIGEEYLNMLRTVRKQYNLESKKICFKHVFNSNSVRRINEQLQNFINTKKIWFGSKLEAHPFEHDKAINSNIPYEFEKKDNIIEFISDQDDLIFQLKKQCSLIEVKSTPLGHQSFDLPVSLKRNTGSNRARKDGYTSLLLGIEGLKAYFDIMKQSASSNHRQLRPFLVGASTMR